MDQFSHCPRCENRTLEHLKTYSHCIDCFYYEDRYCDSESSYFQARAAEAFFAAMEDSEEKNEEADPEDELAS
jgi:hypothetical protein